MSEPTGDSDPQPGPVVDGAGVRPDDGAEGSDAGPTGDTEIDEALALLVALDSTPVGEHAEVVERVHHVLQNRLSDGQE